jgi:hypothetical protein
LTTFDYVHTQQSLSSTTTSKKSVGTKPAP